MSDGRWETLTSSERQAVYDAIAEAISETHDELTDETSSLEEKNDLQELTNYLNLLRAARGKLWGI